VSLRVLIVDDAAFMRSMLKEMFTSSGFQVVGEATDGVEAVDSYNQLRPDVVTMDIIMPNMGGIDALKKIMQINNNAFVVMCSALGQEKMFIEALQAGAREYIVKPFDQDRVVKTIERIYNKRTD